MTLLEHVRAIRNSVGVSRQDHVHYLRIQGEGAFDALDRVCPANLYVRDGQILHGLLLNDDGTLFADVYCACDDEEYMMLAEGPTASEIVTHLTRHTVDIEDVEIEAMGDECSIIGLDGPYAWELMGMVVGEEVIGLPYLSFYHQDHRTCCRVGKTGEYGYMIVVPLEEADSVFEQCLERGAALDAVEVDLQALDQCALENWFMNIRREGREPVTPIELQLQWRVSYGKRYIGYDALARRRVEGPKQRLTCLASDDAVEIGCGVGIEGADVGRIVNAGYSEARGDWVALALIDLPWAHSGIGAFVVTTANGSVAARSVSPPVINNRSLFVSPQMHSYRTRDEFDFPPLTRG